MPPARSLLALVIAFLLVASCGLLTRAPREAAFGMGTPPSELRLTNSPQAPNRDGAFAPDSVRSLRPEF